MLAGVVVATKLGVEATVFYLAMYLSMNMASFAVIVARERETRLGDSIDAVAGLGRERPWLAWPMTISMLALAGIPATAGFIGKFYLIDAAVSGGYTWLGVVIVVGSMISLGYYLPVIAAMWMREAPAGAGAGSLDTGSSPAQPPTPGPGGLPALAGGSPELDVEPSRAPHDAPAARGRVRRRARRGRDDLLRHHPPAAVQPRRPRRRRARRAVLSRNTVPVMAKGARALGRSAELHDKAASLRRRGLKAVSAVEARGGLRRLHPPRRASRRPRAQRSRSW